MAARFCQLRAKALPRPASGPALGHGAPMRAKGGSATSSALAPGRLTSERLQVLAELVEVEQPAVPGWRLLPLSADRALPGPTAQLTLRYAQRASRPGQRDKGGRRLCELASLATLASSPRVALTAPPLAARRDVDIGVGPGVPAATP
jgi:hypothetical protein